MSLPLNPGYGSSSSDRQAPSTHTEMIDHKDAASHVGFRQYCENFAHPPDHGGVVPIALAEQDHARLGDLSEREQTRVVQVNRNDGSPLLLRTRHDGNVGFAPEPEVGGMHGIVPAFGKPCRQ